MSIFPIGIQAIRHVGLWEVNTKQVVCLDSKGFDLTMWAMGLTSILEMADDEEGGWLMDRDLGRNKPCDTDTGEP